MRMEELNFFDAIPVLSSSRDKEVVEAVVLAVVPVDVTSWLSVAIVAPLFSMLGSSTNSWDRLRYSLVVRKAKFRYCPSWILRFSEVGGAEVVVGGLRFSDNIFLERVDDEEEERLFFLEPPPTGTFLRDPPSVQYLLQVLQKCLGWVRL